MSKNLVIVESPAKCKTIKKFLGPDFSVEASMGHIMDLPTKQMGVDIKHGFAPHYILIRGKAKVVMKLKEQVKGAEKIYLATDPDREGEAIAWHLAQQIAEDNVATARITFNEITRDAVREALNDPHQIDMHKVNAQQARRILDRLVGYRVSPLLWKTIHGRLSAGRVQSVALRLICEREAEIEAFEPQEYWTVPTVFKKGSGETFEAELTKVNGKKADITNGDQAAQVKSGVSEQSSFTVESVEKKKTRRHPRPPFITSTLQQDASRKLNFSAKKTMMLAQQLYEGIEIGSEGAVGLITYMRTDSTRIADEAVTGARGYIEKSWGKDFLPESKRVYKSKKGAQDAHEAIRPTDVVRTPDEIRQYVTKDQFRLYELIWKRFIASQMESAVYDQTRADIVAGEYNFTATGSIQVFKGYHILYDEQEEKGKDNSRLLPELEKGEEVTLKKIDPKQHFTQPPPRYTEASLVRELEVKGIGRPSTYAQIISTNVERKYIAIEDRKYMPTELGRVTSTLLVKHFPDVFNVGFTADMEEKLDEIEDGNVEWGNVVKDFYGPFADQVTKVDSIKGDIKKNLQEGTGEKCEKCGSEMVIKWGRNGKFVACSGYPKCRNARPLDGKEEGDDQATDEKCETCGAPMVVKHGRYGRFLACSTYPKCKNTRAIPVGVPCPAEGCDGQIVERNSRRGKQFYSCDRYPKCTFVVWSKPVATKCPHCGNGYMVEKWTKKRGNYLYCPQCKKHVDQPGEQKEG